MTTLKDVQKDKLKQAALYLDEISDVESEEFWRLFIEKLPQKIYTEDQIETFAEAGNTTTGSPSFKLLCDLRERGLTYKTFIKCLETIKCTKAFNLFTQTTIPVISEHPSSQSLQCGDVLLLRCRGDCVPSPPQYQWYWNDTPLLDQTDSVLKISDVNTSHAGDYKCVVTNPYINDDNLNRSVTSHTVKVEILKYPIPETNTEPFLYPESEQSENESRIRSGSAASVTPRDALCEANKDIEITVQPLDLECRYNETFQLECIAKSRSGKPITYKWIRKKPGRSVTLHSEERVKNIDGFVTEVVSDEAKVTIHSIWFEQQPKPVYGYIGQYALLHCEAVGKGPIQYLWLKNEGDRKVKVDQTCMEYGVLEFLSLQGNHWGQYICQAQNEEEFVPSNVVTVECEPKKTEKSLRIVAQPKSYVCMRDDSITLTCEAVSMREICYQWYHDDKELRNETLDILALSSINDLQFGSYHCVVTSGAESVTSDKANVVRGLPIDSSKIINQTQTDQRDAEQSFQTADGKIYAREKIAILIGNKKYDCSEIKSLTNPHNDVMLLSDTLSKIGFKVFSFSDVRFGEMMKILDYFCRLLDSGVYFVFYYSGHGFSYQNMNYIMPVDVTLPISCDACIPAELVSYRLQLTKSKVFMFLDCCRVSYDDKAVMGPTKPSQNECGFANIYKIWSCSASKPAYERASEESSVFNSALRNALEERTPAKNLISKVLEYMMKKGLSKDGKEYQRPVAIIQLSPQEITLHEDVMYDRYMKESVKEFEQLYKKMHHLSPLHIGPDNLAGLATGDVKYTFVMTNILLVSLVLIKSDKCKELSVLPNVHLADIHVAEKSMENPKSSRLITYEFEVTSLQQLKNPISNFLKIDAVNHTEHHYTYGLPTTLEACDFYHYDH